MRGKPILCLDFDGVVHSYKSGWQGETDIPDPAVPGALDFIRDSMRYFDIHIFSSRSKYSGGIKAMKQWLVEQAIVRFGIIPSWLDLISWPTEKPPAFLSIDDRGLCFEGTWPNPVELLNFKPWYKR